MGSGGGAPRTGAIYTLRVMAFNLAKAGLYEEGPLASPASIESRLDRVIDVIDRERCDLVFLSEVVFEAGPRAVDQARYLARAGRFAAYASGENYRFGIPWLRVRSGNAILARLPLRPVATVQLAGGRPFWNPTNNRRVLWCEVDVNGAPLLVGAIRNDSFDLANNERQVEEILAFVGERAAILAGDFNAEPGSPPLRRIVESCRFVGAVDGPPTYPAAAPTRRIDDVFAPAGWELVEEHVVEIEGSDHRAVVAEFRLP